MISPSFSHHILFRKLKFFVERETVFRWLLQAGCRYKNSDVFIICACDWRECVPISTNLYSQLNTASVYTPWEPCGKHHLLSPIRGVLAYMRDHTFLASSTSAEQTGIEFDCLGDQETSHVTSEWPSQQASIVRVFLRVSNPPCMFATPLRLSRRVLWTPSNSCGHLRLLRHHKSQPQ